MNSLVVFLSVVAVAVAKPSGVALNAGLLAYSSPIIAAAPAAVSHQSRLDIKSSPAVVATAAVAPIARTVIAAPAVLSAPAIATAAIAPAAISSQSRIDIKSSPAITSTIVSAPVAYNAPALAYSAPALTYSSPALAYNAPLLNTAVAPALLKTDWSAPAPLIDAHLIKKRSAQLIAAPLVSSHWAAPIATTYAASPLLSTYHTSPLAYSSNIALSAPVITKTYGVNAW